MMSLHQRNAFTLVEVLVALALLSVILGALLSLTSSTLRFTGLSQAVSTSVEDIADAEGYLSDMLRSARAVYGSVQFDVYECSNEGDAAGSCIGVITPVLGSGDDEPIENFNLSVFAVTDIGNLYAERGLPTGFSEAEEAPLTLVEYRREGLCSTSCATLAELRADVVADPDSDTRLNDIVWETNRPIGVLVGGLVQTDGDGNGVEFFSIPADADFTVEVTLVARANAAASQPFVVRRVPVSLRVAVRD